VSAPFYWMYETSEVLRPAIEALQGGPMTEAQIAAMRAYLRQWIAAPWKGPGIDALRQRIDDLTSREAIESWLETHHRSAVKEGEL
jgi:hypothetical protein